MNDLEKNNYRNGKDENKKAFKSKLSGNGTYVALGIVFGAGIGVTMDNISIGVALGLVIGASMEAIADKNKKRQ